MTHCFFMELIGLRTRKILPKKNLETEVLFALSRKRFVMGEGDILILASKVVSVCEGRVIDLTSILPSKRALRSKKTRYGTDNEDPRIIELALREADRILAGKMLLTVTRGIVIPASGIDQSNVQANHAVLWPVDPEESAYRLMLGLKKQLCIKKMGVVIADSRLTPLRRGTTGVALAWAGFEGIVDARGKKDIFGKRLTVTQLAVADNLATSAQLLMGEGASRVPFVIARGAPVKFTRARQKSSAAVMPLGECIFSEIFK